MDPTPRQTEGNRPYQPPRSDGRRSAIVVGTYALLLALAGGGLLWWQGRAPGASTRAPVPAAAPVAVADAASDAAPAEPVIQHPIESAASAAVPALPRLDQSDSVVARGLTELVGAKSVLAMLQTDAFVRRVVATVDNLGRAHAAPRLWPVMPSGGKFSVRRVDNADVIAADNSARYAPFVSFVESVDTRRAVALYVSLYPLFQQAYQELGYPKGYFNDRLVAVIDQLLATPEPVGPLAVHLTEVKGPIASDRPWVRYEFADPALEALPAGSKMLLRTGPENARRLKAKLAELRSAIAHAPARKP
jgi:hypothetical protein